MAHAIQVIYTLKDNKGKLSTCTIKVPTGLTVANYIEFAQEMGSLVVNLTIGQIVNVGVAITVDISGLGWPTAPGVTSDVEEKGAFQFVTAGNFSTGTAVPTLSELLVVDGSDALDQSDSDVSDFITAMTDGLAIPVGAITVHPCDGREDDITALVYARERFRASGKRP